MTDQPTKNTHSSWEAMQGYPVVLLVMAFLPGALGSVYGADQIAPVWNRGIPAVLNGSAIVIWTLLITRKTIEEKVRFVVPIIIISGVGLIGLGVWWVRSSIFP